MVALDGNPVPSPRSVTVLTIAPAERVDATVEMDRPRRSAQLHQDFGFMTLVTYVYVPPPGESQ
jgi:FtsP/CotA-like multicopper oxidase with cupredoxin domain